MANLMPIAFFGLQVLAGDNPTPVMSELPGVSIVRVTMAAIDPSATPFNEEEPKRATLKLLRRPIDPDEFMNDDYEDSDEESEEDSDNEEDGGKESGGTSKAKKQADAAIKKALKVAEANAMEVDPKKGLNEDEDEDSDDDDDDELEIEEFVICTLDAENHYQQTLDIVLREEEEAYFKVAGNYEVSLTGYYAVSSNQNMPGDDDYSEDDEEDSDFDLSPSEDDLVGMLDELDDESDELDNVDTPRITEINSDDDKKAGKKLSKAEKKSLKRGAEDEPKAEEPKLSKKQQKKLKANDGKAVETSTETPEKKKVQFAKNLEQGPTKDKKTPEKTPEKNPGKAAAAGPSKKVVQGITIEDKKAGSGPAARNGQKLGMRYIGKLDNGQVFDSNTKGKPFTFRLGKGEVIKGWDIGLAGMQVGGERRVIVPANMAYGKKGVPGIPGNSTLTFDVKLLEIK